MGAESTAQCQSPSTPKYPYVSFPLRPDCGLTVASQQSPIFTRTRVAHGSQPQLNLVARRQRCHQRAYKMSVYTFGQPREVGLLSSPTWQLRLSWLATGRYALVACALTAKEGAGVHSPQGGSLLQRLRARSFFSHARPPFWGLTCAHETMAAQLYRLRPLVHANP